MTKSLILILFISCSSLQKKEQEKQEHYSKSSVLQLVSTTYVKGCIDGIHLITPDRTYGVNLEKCKTLAKKHVLSIDELLE
jgi:hypothetical protein